MSVGVDTAIFFWLSALHVPLIALIYDRLYAVFVQHPGVLVVVIEVFFT